jgi:signal transduction histidine kinase/ActR/RegA family two-component response regulator
MLSEDDKRIQDALDHTVLHAFRPVLMGLTVLYLIFAISHKLVLPKDIADLMVAVAFGSSVVCGILRWVLKREFLPVQHAHLLGTGVAAIMLGNSAIHFLLTGDWLQTTNFLLIVIGIACLFLSRLWFGLVCMMAIGSWALVAWVLPPSPALLHFGFAFVTTFFLAIIIFLIRVRNFRRLEAFRLLDEKQKRDLAAALEITKTSNEALEHNNRQLAEARDAAEVASRIKSEFLANMSHEIRTPLNAIIGLADLMLQNELPDDQGENIAMIQTSGIHLLDILNNILDFAKIEAERLELEYAPFSVHEQVVAVYDILQIGARKKNLKFRYEVADDVPKALIGDAVRIRQVLLNLVGNAIKFTHEGEVDIAVHCVTQTSQQATLHFVVRDTGIGLSADEKTRIFEAFSQADSSTTREYGGTGLGLSISVRLIEAMNGRFWVESEKGRGSIFQFEVSFDMADALAEAVAIHVDQKIYPLKILLAEDNVVNQRVAIRMLEKEGHVVRVVGDGQQALLALSEEQFDVLLTDIQMPEMDGVELAQKIRASEKEGGPRQKIIALTAHASEEDRQLCIASGMDDYLTKPIRRRDLMVVLQQIAAQN